MKTVHSNHEIPHLWAHQTQETARNSSKSVWFYKEILYSYREPIGVIVTVKGKQVALFRDRRFSVTTAKHQGSMQRAASHLPHFTVASICGSFSQRAEHLDHKLNLVAYQKRIDDKVLAASRARSNAEYLVSCARNLVVEANEYAETFGLKTRFILPNAKELIERSKREAEKAAAERKRVEDKARADAQPIISQWVNGGSEQVPWFITEAYMRIEGEELVTSRGARVPLAHVVRVMPIVKRLIERGEEYHANGHTIHLGHYQLDRIDTDGTIHAGCHHFTRNEVLRMFSEIEHRSNLVTV